MKKDHWILIVFLLTFILSIIFSTISNVIAVSCNNIVLFIVLVVTISFGILFDVIGTAAITANEATFHALNSKKIKGAKQGIVLIKNSNKISSICNDIVGDICGIISGSIGAILAISFSLTTGLNNTLVSVILAAFISAFTVGGKAIFKVVAINNADNIILTVSKVISIFGGNK
jgi:Mg2+/Co2+ transporter CorB